MQYSIEELIKLVINESILRRKLLLVLFVVIGLSVLAAGSVWPKKFTSSAVIYVDDRNIIQPLMQGTAVATEQRDHARNAREIILGNQILKNVLEGIGDLESNPTPIEVENLIDSIRNKTVIRNVGQNLIKIEYQDSNARRSFIAVKRMAALFIEAGKEEKVEESRAAYEFIEKQTVEYLQKLTDVDNKLKEFHANNPDARPGSQNEIASRINSLQGRIETARLELREAEIRKISLQDQLSGEAAITISQSKEGQYRARIANLRSEMETLLLTYTDTYPDVVRHRHQIEDLEQALEQEIIKREESIRAAKSEGKTYLDQQIVMNPIYQTLRTNLSETETQIATLNARVKEMNNVLESEYDKLKRIQEGEALMQDLTRDYQVNQEIYQDLLKRRENARVSRSLEAESQGLSFKILEPATLPLRPTGLRFMHFAALGILGGLVGPIMLIYMLVQLDPRVRSSAAIESMNPDYAVLATIPQYKEINETQHLKKDLVLFSVVFISMIIGYGVVGWYKLSGV